MDVNEQRDYLTLHLDINSSKGTACSKKWYRCKWTERLSNITHIKVRGQLVVRNDIDVNEQRDYPTLHTLK
jgi:hypothetical protein